MISPDNSPLKTVVGQNAHFFVSISSLTNVPWKEVNWFKLNGRSFSDFNRVYGFISPKVDRVTFLYQLGRVLK